jgi:hypothetical protein
MHFTFTPEGNTMRRPLLVALIAMMTVVGLANSSTSARAADLDCGDFASQPNAQHFFGENGGNPHRTIDNLDANHNGVACEDYPYGSNGAQPTAAPTVDSGATPVVTDPGNGRSSGPSQPSAPVAALPNTGSGSARSHLDVAWLAIAFASVMAIAGVAYRRKQA